LIETLGELGSIGAWTRSAFIFFGGGGVASGSSFAPHHSQPQRIKNNCKKNGTMESFDEILTPEEIFFLFRIGRVTHSTKGL
jgi:hypothetical protein